MSIFLPRFFLFLFRHSILLLFAFFSIHFDSLQISAAEFTCPPWLSLDAMKLIARILDPNPMTVSTMLQVSTTMFLDYTSDFLLLQRITVPEILEDEWFKKDYKPPVFEEPKIANLDDVEAVFKDSEVCQILFRYEYYNIVHGFSLSTNSFPGAPCDREEGRTTCSHERVRVNFNVEGAQPGKFVWYRTGLHFAKHEH